MIGIIIVFLVSIHLAVGMLVSLVLVSQKELSENFFRLNTTISLALLALAQSTYAAFIPGEGAGVINTKVLYWKSHIDAANPFLWAAAIGCLFYLLSLPFRKLLLSKSLIVIVSLLGIGALGVLSSGLSHRAISPSIDRFIFTSDLVLSALALGSVTICMILGHWYLVDPRMSVRHLQVIAALFIAVVCARVLLGTYTSVLIWKDLESTGGDLFSNFVLVNILFLGQRILFGLALPLALSWMIWQTIKIRSTQSATGILYVAVVFILFGEFLSHYILVSTGYPL